MPPLHQRTLHPPLRISQITKTNDKRINRIKCDTTITMHKNKVSKSHFLLCNTCLHSKGLEVGSLHLTWYCPLGLLCNHAHRIRKYQQPSHKPVSKENNTFSLFRTKTPKRHCSDVASPPPTRNTSTLNLFQFCS